MKGLIVIIMFALTIPVHILVKENNELHQEIQFKDSVIYYQNAINLHNINVHQEDSTIYYKLQHGDLGR